MVPEQDHQSHTKLQSTTSTLSRAFVRPLSRLNRLNWNWPRWQPKLPRFVPAYKRVRMGTRRLPDRQKRLKVFLVGLAGLLVLAVVFAFVGLRLAKGTPHVTVYTVHAQVLSSYVGGGGLTYPLQSLNVAYPISAQVIKVDVQVGQVVQPGQPLLTLDSAGLTAQLEQAYSQWQIAQRYVDSLMSAGATSAQIAAAQQQAAIAKNRYDTLNAQINSPSFNHGNIVATFAGIVTAVNVTPGTLFRANTPLLTLQDISSVIVRAQFPLEQRAQIQLKNTAEIEPAATPGQRFTGQITAINPALSNAGSDTFEVWITVPNPNQLLFTGESVYARVHGKQQLPTVPELAVINPESDSIVFVYANGRAHVRHVVVGARDGDRLGIVSGLRPGDQVILTGQYQLSDNQPVIVSATEP